MQRAQLTSAALGSDLTKLQATYPNAKVEQAGGLVLGASDATDVAKLNALAQFVKNAQWTYSEVGAFVGSLKDVTTGKITFAAAVRGFKNDWANGASVTNAETTTENIINKVHLDDDVISVPLEDLQYAYPQATFKDGVLNLDASHADNNKNGNGDKLYELAYFIYQIIQVYGAPTDFANEINAQASGQKGNAFATAVLNKVEKPWTATPNITNAEITATNIFNASGLASLPANEQANLLNSIINVYPDVKITAKGVLELGTSTENVNYRLLGLARLVNSMASAYNGTVDSNNAFTNAINTEVSQPAMTPWISAVKGFANPWAKTPTLENAQIVTNTLLKKSKLGQQQLDNALEALGYIYPSLTFTSAGNLKFGTATEDSTVAGQITALAKFVNSMANAYNGIDDSNS